MVWGRVLKCPSGCVENGLWGRERKAREVDGGSPRKEEPRWCSEGGKVDRLEMCFGDSSGWNGGPQRDKPTSGPLEPTNVTSFGKRIFASTSKLKIWG